MLFFTSLALITDSKREADCVFDWVSGQYWPPQSVLLTDCEVIVSLDAWQKTHLEVLRNHLIKQRLSNLILVCCSRLGPSSSLKNTESSAYVCFRCILRRYLCMFVLNNRHCRLESQKRKIVRMTWPCSGYGQHQKRQNKPTCCCGLDLLQF